MRSPPDRRRFVLLLFIALAALLALITPTLSPSDRPPAIRPLLNTPHTEVRSALPVACYDAIMGTFVRSAEFYRSGRAIPDTAWVNIFMRSAVALNKHSSRSSCSVRVILWVDPTTRETLLPLAESLGAAVTLIAVSNETHGSSLLHHRWANNVKNAANNYRFALYGDWLRRQRDEGTSPRRVLFTDVTDVVFQDDPFEFNCFVNDSEPRQVIFTLEAATFAKEKYNRRWMSCFGEPQLRRLAAAKSPVSCAGVTLATAEGGLAYCDAILKLISMPEIMACSEERIGAALDQAAHNVLLHSDTLSAPPSLRPVVLDGNDGFARRTAPPTCAFHGNFGTFAISGDRLVAVRGKGLSPVLPAVVHQYTSNRIPTMMRIAQRLWLPSVPRSY